MHSQIYDSNVISITINSQAPDMVTWTSEWSVMTQEILTLLGSLAFISQRSSPLRSPICAIFRQNRRFLMIFRQNRHFDAFFRQNRHLLPIFRRFRQFSSKPGTPPL